MVKLDVYLCFGNKQHKFAFVGGCMIKRVLSLIAVMISVIFLNNISVLAFTNGHSQAEAVQWARDRANEHWEINDDSGWTQCTEFVWSYYEYLIGYHVSGDANDYVWDTYGACPYNLV